ncbi:uncharacterized protein CCR75_002142 [Bremia lactucae]|uniref:B30.2/SPRY domain-containing protein n=1 Tax=Bremia lactucae TaxID=4779 RepID=A0A976FDW6_BRELC|nr:hypothetical protein CCR75_002142 [Bremia lactucae]
MGQHISQPSAVIESPSDRTQLRPLQAPYAPLCDVPKPGDSSVTDDTKDTMDKILEFGAALRYLPKESEVSESLAVRNLKQELNDIMSPVDSMDELFQLISQLAGLPTQDGHDPSQCHANREVSETMPGIFDARVASYVKHLQALYQMTKKEKSRYEHQLGAAREQALSLRKVSPPPLPQPTQSAMTMGWDLVVMLLKATRKKDPAQYETALQMVKNTLKSLKPSAYSDSMYLAQSAASAFNLLSDCLHDLLDPTTDGSIEEEEAVIEARTVETLAEVGLTRGSLATMLFVVQWLLKQPTTSKVNLDTTLCKLAALKEQPMYGKCEAFGELYSCGQNAYGELGIGDEVERHQLTSVALCGWKDIRQVASGNETLAVLTNDGVVLTCGLNKSGQCGQGHSDDRVVMLRPVQSLRSQRIKYIAASNGCEHMIALTDAGLAYSWGYNDRGQLGHENLTTKLHAPKLIEALKNKLVTFAAVSYHHSAVITDKGELYTFGMNDCGQLGLDHTQHQSTPQLAKSLEGMEVAMVACGLYHTIICTAAGGLYACGKNDYGQLGMGHNRLLKVATFVSLPNEKVCFVACGYYHSMVVTTDGRTFSCGRNDYGQLGLGNKTHQNALNVVALTANTKMIRATCGCYHTVLLSEEGQVFVFGRNNKGQLGNRRSADALLPVPLKIRSIKDPRRCVDVAAGFYTTSLIVEQKRENDEGDSSLLDHSCIISICGRVDIDQSGEMEGLSNFGSISTMGVSLTHGTWFYEVEVVTSGLIQVGWIDGYFQGNSDQGEGVGDHTHSWSYDGNRQRRWNSGSSSYGEKWRAGDIIGCLLDLMTQEMTFFRNGVNLGIAYSELHCSIEDERSGLMPGISLERGEIIRVNLGHRPFAYPPTIGHEFESISRAVKRPAGSAAIEVLEDGKHENISSRPPPLEGSASVLVGSKLYVVGGVVVHETGSPHLTSEATHFVWAFDTLNKMWERWADFPIEICHHQVVAIGDKLLVLGGEKNCATSRHMDLYTCSTIRNADGSLPTWALIQPSNMSMPPSRAFHTASVVSVRRNSVVFMYGGKSVENEVLGDAWHLSVDDYKWFKLPSTMSLNPGPRLGCSSAVIGECVYLFGGMDRDESYRSDLWRYNTFDRLWHLCHDDQFQGAKDVASSGSMGKFQRKFQHMIPEGRVQYSMCSDAGSIWIFGGVNKVNTLLCDMWYYSVSLQHWNQIQMDTQGEMDGCCSAAIHIRAGTITALPTLSHSAPFKSNVGELLLFGGRIHAHGQRFLLSKVCRIYQGTISDSYHLGMTSGMSTSSKAGNFLNVLRSRCEVGNSSSQHCTPEARDSAICLLAHLDRLASDDIPAEDADSVQMSRCLYRSLCIDLKASTFSALYALLDDIMSRFLGILNQDMQLDTTHVIPYVLYPLLVTIRLLKLNFFEFSRSCLAATEIGFLASSTDQGGVLYSIQKALFILADHVPSAFMSKEVIWFYQAVKQETALAIYHGFPTMFPSLSDRIQIMNRLMANTNTAEAEWTPSQKLILPRLFPYFTSAKMLFQLFCDPNMLFQANNDSDETVSACIIKFIGTLLDALWGKTKKAMEKMSKDMTQLMENFDAVEKSHEFKCLNILLRAAIYWCACSVNQSWGILESVCTLLVRYLVSSLDQCSRMNLNQREVVPIILQHSFSGKLLPFVILSALSLPAVREALPALLKTVWPEIEALLTRLHSILLVVIKQNVSPPTRVPENVSSDIYCNGVTDFVDTAPVNISEEFAQYLFIQRSEPIITYGQVLQKVFDKIIRVQNFTSCKVKALANSVEIRRIRISADLAKILGSNSLLVKVGAAKPESLLEYDSRKISFGPSRTILSQHIYPINDESVNDMGRNKVSHLSPQPQHSITKGSVISMEQSHEWLIDLHKVLSWVGSHYAAALLLGDESNSVFVKDRWLNSPLFQGGLEEPRSDMVSNDDINVPSNHNVVNRNEILLQQVIDNVGNGKKLLDKVRCALDPESKLNPQLRFVKLRRQDSIEASLEKSGGHEAVDRAVRAAFAALLKHTNISYTTDPISDQGTLAETVVNAWKAALQLRRWIVREQQKLAAAYSETGAPSILSANMEAKDRQQALYNAVCEPIIRRALVLLQLAAVPIQSTSPASSPLKILPGISMASHYDFGKSPKDESVVIKQEQKRYTRQLDKLMETKSMEMMEEEDVQINLDIFLFLQHSDETSRNVQGSTRHSEDQMLDTLLAHQKRATMRLQGIQTFSRLLQSEQIISNSRVHVIAMLSWAFKRVHATSRPSNQMSSGHISTVKVHYLVNLEFAGPRLSDAIKREFFHLMSLLLESSMEYLHQILQLIDTRIGGGLVSTNNSIISIPDSVKEVLIVLEVCCLPYQGQDWDYLQRTKLMPLLMELISWRGWQRFIQYEESNSIDADTESVETYVILPASIGLRDLSIKCSRNLTFGTDLGKVKVAHYDYDATQSLHSRSGNGGLVVLDRCFYRGRWYWEVSIHTLGDTPIFVGITFGTADLNTYVPGDSSLCGIFLYQEGTSKNIFGSAGISWQYPDVLGVVLNCEKRQVEFFNGASRCHVATFTSLDVVGCGIFPSIGMKSASVHWNLTARVPPKIWHATSANSLATPNITGGLIAIPPNEATISWNRKRKGKHLEVGPNGTTVIAGTYCSIDNSFETIAASQGFDKESIFIEVRVIAAGKDGISILHFGIIGCDPVNFEAPLKHKLNVTFQHEEEVVECGVFGVLFDLENASITLYSESMKPRACQLDLATVSKPLFPAVSVLCNGTVFDVSFNPCSRFDLPSPVNCPASKCQFLSDEAHLGKRLDLRVHACDGEELSTSHAARNCLLDDTTVYSTTKGSNVNLVLKHAIDTPMCIASVTIRGPRQGYSSPLQYAAIFITSNIPDPMTYQEADNMTPEQFAALPFPPCNGFCSRDESLPVAFIVLDGSGANVSKQLAYPVIGRYILVKAICPSAGTNIDIGYIGFFGLFNVENGPAYCGTAIASDNMVGKSYCCDECNISFKAGMFYYGQEENRNKLCVACYDDNRGDVNCKYYASFAGSSQGDTLNLETLLCPTRRSWTEKIEAFCDGLIQSETVNVATQQQNSLSDIFFSDSSFEQCELFSCGQNNYGELCLGHCNSSSQLERVPHFSAKAIRDIVGGNEVLAVVMKDGRVLTCGLNKSGQCGIGTFEERVIMATPVRALNGISIRLVAAANGCEHMLAVTTEGTVYSWGYNDRGQLGLGLTLSKSHTPRKIESLRDKYLITTAAVSYHHSAVISSNGELLMFGMNDCGQLGLNHTQHQSTPQFVDSLSSQFVTKVACGLYHTIVSTRNGDVYSFGKNDYGQLGLGHTRNIQLPTLVKISFGEDDIKIKDVNCGYYHTVTISDQGKLVTWGRNDYGQLGIGSKDHKQTAQLVPLPLSTKIISASCGCYHTLILKANGRVMAFGRNNKGQLGTGPRTLASADLPLPVPSNALVNVEAVKIAAGFYSSYILIGCSDENHQREGAHDKTKQTQHLPEDSLIENYDCLFLSLMEEIDANYKLKSRSKRAPLQVKRKFSCRKVPLLKLHAAGWAMTRALMYRSLQDADDKTRDRSAGCVNPILATMINFLLENMALFHKDTSHGNTHTAVTETMSARIGGSISVKRLCVCLFQHFGFKVASPTSNDMLLETSPGHYYKNQLSSVLLKCGSANTKVGSIVAANSDITSHVIRGIDSCDIATAFMCIKLAMLVFPHHSVSALNRIYRSQERASGISIDIVTMLMTLVGLPLVKRPRICSQDLGSECSTAALYHSVCCQKGIAMATEVEIANMQQLELEKTHIADAKAAEIVALLRYLTLYPTWKVAINAALSRGFKLSDSVEQLLETVCTYYTNVEKVDSFASVAVRFGLYNVNEAVAVRNAESTIASPEIDEDIKNTVDDVDVTMRDKRSLLPWQKAKEALDKLAIFVATICIVGGHVEGFREGGFVAIEEQGPIRFGVLSGITRDPQTANLLAKVVVTVSVDDPVSPLIPAKLSSQMFSLSKLHVVERIPPMIHMFDDFDNILITLSSLIAKSSSDYDEDATHCDLEQPNNRSANQTLRNHLIAYKQQIQWRAAKAIASLLMQMSSLSLTLSSIDSQFVSNLATLISSENCIARASKLKSSSLETATNLQKRWMCVKQRQVFLETEEILNSALDQYELNICHQVVAKLTGENVLSWEMGAIQSPRQKVGHTSPVKNGIQRQQSDLLGDESVLPFGTWGVLIPLPPLTDSEHSIGTSGHSAIDYKPFPLTASIVRVGRAADACDLLVNDRSVSGRHFHLRRLRNGMELEEARFELQDFSKNGTIVDGVRIHGSSAPITTGSRISLILSRGGLVTYEFQARTAASVGRQMPLSDIYTTQNSEDLNIMVPGQEYQLSQVTFPAFLPRSPAEIQNRGSGHSAATEGLGNGRRRDTLTQSLRVITSIAESDVPRAIVSPNPAVDSPRPGGYNSPRSSLLQPPGTPVARLPSSSVFASTIPSGILSPASHQQRESSSPNNSAGLFSPRSSSGNVGSMLRISLGRDSVNRESLLQRMSNSRPDKLPKTRIDCLGLICQSNESLAVQEMQALAFRLHARAQDAQLVVSVIECEEALRISSGKIEEAFAALLQSRSSNSRNFAIVVRHLARILGRSESVCAKAFHQANNDVSDALRYILSSKEGDLESSRHYDALGVYDDQNGRKPSAGYQSMIDDNPSYALLESSALCPSVPQRLKSPVRPHVKEYANMKTTSFRSNLTLWSECNSSFDDDVRQMNAFEVELESGVLSKRLAAIHARQIVLQIVRLLKTASQTEEVPLQDLSNLLVLRPLISALYAPGHANTSVSHEAASALHQQTISCTSGKMQEILSRMVENVMMQSPVETMARNLCMTQNISIFQRSIDDAMEQPSRSGWTGMARLFELLVESENAVKTHPGEDRNDQTTSNTLEDLTFDTILHIISRTHAVPAVARSYDSFNTQKLDGSFPKGPLQLSCGLQVIVVNTYERLWSIPTPDPLREHRHKWRKRGATKGNTDYEWMKATADSTVTLWRPKGPPALNSSITWFGLGDVAKSGIGAPDAPMLLISDYQQDGLLAPPVRYDRMDISGKGLPRNADSYPDFQRKQLRSIWWPVAPSGYAALGCIAGSKEDPFKPPDISWTCCVREDLVKRLKSLSCVWCATSLSSTGGGDIEHSTVIKNERKDSRPVRELDDAEASELDYKGKNQSMNFIANDVIVKTSLWASSLEFGCGLLLPVVKLNDTSENELAAYGLDLTDDDRVLCGPISVDNVLTCLEALLCYQQQLRTTLQEKASSLTQLRSELPAAIFALIRQVLCENQASSGKAAVALLRALITVVQRGTVWYDKSSLLYCRSKIIALSQDQDTCFTLPGLLQAFIELMLTVEDQQRKQQIQDLVACSDQDGETNVSLPYRFHFFKQPAQDMVVSHSSKMKVTRQLAGKERKFEINYIAKHNTNGSNAGPDLPLEDVWSCRFEHTPALIMTMRDKVKAEIVYFEVTVVEWNTTTTFRNMFALGFSSLSFPLEGVPVGSNVDGSRSYAFAPASGQIRCADDPKVDRWRWVESASTSTIASGDIIGCGLCLGTQELFICKNGQLFGTAFSSISRPHQLHPTISINSDCKLLVNLGTTTTKPAKHANFSYRFCSFECNNIMSAFEWFEPLSQVYGVMKALMNPARLNEVTVGDEFSVNSVLESQLPDEFMLSADTFLSRISEDACIRVESSHPYDMEFQESLVKIPLATSIRVHLDVQSDTASSHCLQIVQGGSMDGDLVEATLGEVELRAFTGACGGQEVTVIGDSFVWRFPVQSNFQCRVDRVRKGPYLKLEMRDTRMSLVRDKGWQTAIGVARFDCGVHIWEVCIAFVTASSNIFLGIARRDVRLDSYLGKDSRGWGWIGNRALWHNGSKQRGTYGDKFKTGDIIRLTLDLRRGTLSYTLNGRDLGVAFGPGGTGPKLEGIFYPAFALYNQRDSIELIGGHRVENGGLEQGLLRTESGLASEDDSYYSEDEEELEGYAGSDAGVDDDSVPNFRMESAIFLREMGFPMEWCVFALRQCNDNPEQAADFILANADTLETLIRDENVALARRTRQRLLMHEQVLASFENAESGDANDAAVIPPPPPMEQITDAISPAEDFTYKEAATTYFKPSNGDARWGIALTAVPEYSITGRRLLAIKYEAKLHRLHASQHIFNDARDRALVQLVNEICEARAEALQSCDPLRMTPEEFVLTEAQIHAFPVLRGVPLEALQRRFLVLRNFNCRLQTSLAFIDFSASDEQSLLARGARTLRGLVFQHVKLAWWLGVLREQQAPAAARPEIEVDRTRAHDALELSERGDALASEAGERDSVFAQTFTQLHGLQPALLRGADRAFKVQFLGEFGDDFGGLYRECLAHLSSELQTIKPLLPLLRPCPNALMSMGENRELFVPNANLRTSARRVQMAEFLGKLAGVAIRTKTPLDLNLPSAVWKSLVGQQVERHDIEAIHDGCFQVMDTIANLDSHGITEAMFEEIVDANFTVLSSARETVQLVPGGKHLHVTWNDRDDYARAVESYRLTEFAPVCEDIVRGMATILPVPTLGILSWHELRTLVCGKASVDVALLQRRTIYGDGCHATDPHIGYFWDVLTNFTEEQKSSFLRFVWGRSRLPTHAADFTQDFKIAGLPKAAGRADMYLPLAHTCTHILVSLIRFKLLYKVSFQLICPPIHAKRSCMTSFYMPSRTVNQLMRTTRRSLNELKNTAATVTATTATTMSTAIAGSEAITREQ